MTEDPVLDQAARAASPRLRPFIFGVLNVTPDSFSDGGEHDDLESAVAFATALYEAGADVVDVGGESTRPGAVRVDLEEEQRRVLPVVRELAARGMTVSVDTMNADTARRSAELGATIINDVSSGADPEMPGVIADSDLLYIAMHSRLPGVGGTDRADYTDTVGEVRAELADRVAVLLDRGVDAARIVVDPGLGFSKRAKHNWELLAGLGRLADLGHPVLVGASRKAFLGDLLPAGAPRQSRDAATSVISALAADAGAWGVRVHDVAGSRLALDVWTAWNGERR